MEGLLSLLLFAGLFFVMMRMGCGAHMKHGHGKNKANQTDPVCGLKIDTSEGYGKMYKGNLYRFCSLDCLGKFEVNPEQYVINNIPNQKHHHQGGAL